MARRSRNKTWKGSYLNELAEAMAKCLPQKGEVHDSFGGFFRAVQTAVFSKQRGVGYLDPIRLT